MAALGRIVEHPVPDLMLEPTNRSGLRRMLYRHPVPINASFMGLAENNGFSAKRHQVEIRKHLGHTPKAGIYDFEVQSGRTRKVDVKVGLYPLWLLVDLIFIASQGQPPPLKFLPALALKPLQIVD